MFTKSNEKISLLRYWTSRYLITLCIGLIVVAIVSALWIRHTTLEHRLNLTKLMAQELADQMVYISEGRPIPREKIPGLITNRGKFMDIKSDPSIYVVDNFGTVLATNRASSRMFLQFPQQILGYEKDIQKLKLQDERTFYVVKAPIKSDYALLGWVFIIETEGNLTRVDQEYRQLAIMIISLAILGWAAIYFLSRRLATPIKDVAKAAKQVQEGDYNIHLPEDIKEQEVYELVHSFKEMSNRLQKLEALRTELLAGVTHELKTPVTSISGLLQALNDEVVTGEEAKEFLSLSLVETAKMKKLVEDLLTFNTFAANAVPVTKEKCHINRLISELTHQWELVQEDQTIELSVSLLDISIEIDVDPIRLQQIITNLLNNAKHAIEGHGKINVQLSETVDQILIDIKDTGSGIPAEEQDLIFERFFRGEEKKYKVRGLGLGLPFSKMIAQSLGGDLILLASSPAGTTFRIILPKNEY
ncbi:HAMP domain-containing histidine kinase [Cytobacillus depressus]|uniref:histidine kinase n=1 Tax=Cytobacillus depressus TaxID=1602942 RepID=A0A6L3V6F9_9BACI|nr:HAMP domain-containing sensor histidine kinase [Cytobacillus depressus]KAB2330505.1 HAMP domain-containing histidine kinase [Cytobacillus depressus]